MMVFEKFNTKFKVTSDASNVDFDLSSMGRKDDKFLSCITELGGKTFNDGLYRVCRWDNIQPLTLMMEKVFPEVKGRILCFSYDWLGRVFSLDLDCEEKKSPLILLLEPGSGEVMNIPVSIIEFHNEEIVNYTNEALAFDFFNNWRQEAKISLEYQYCAGYKIPLFLGGSDTVDNLEIIDMDVYITICGELRNKAKKLPEGTSIQEIFLE